MMKPSDLVYAALKQRLEPLMKKGRSESATFLNWFLKNIYRLEDVAADDSICDAQNDKGIDGIYIDDNNEEIHFFQAKLRQKASATIGDVEPKTFAASVQQFDSPAKVEAVLQNKKTGTDLRNLLVRLEVKDLLAKGYAPIGVYVSNEKADSTSEAYAALNPQIRFYDRVSIANSFVETGGDEGIDGEFQFDVSQVTPLRMTIPAKKGEPSPELYIFPALASELVQLGGVSDAKLFSQNVRFDLGNTAVNKSIKKSIDDTSEHKHFALFHNGIIILCREAVVEGEKLKISRYAVVNGAQSITTFYKSKDKLTKNLRVLVRVIALQNEALARRITENSNNQNAIKPRDLRSNHTIMTRLQKEFDKKSPDYFFEIKRGERAPSGRTVIANDDAGRALLAIDLQEPWSCHQIYKVFDEKYAEIFGRKEVTAARIIFAMRLDALVKGALDKLTNKPMGHYALTKYFMLYVLGRIARDQPEARAVMQAPDGLKPKQINSFLGVCRAIVANAVIDLNYEVSSATQNGGTFDYKAILKSPKQTDELANNLIKSYEKDVARKKVKSFAGWS